MKTTATINPEQGYVTSTVDFADVHVTSASMADLSAPLSPRVLRGMADPSLAYKERYGGYGSRSEWEEAEYDLWEPGVVEDTESYFRQFIRKKKGLAFKEGYEFVGRDSDTIDYIHDRFMWLETAQGKSMRLLFKETMHELLQKSNSYWFKVRDDKASNGKMRTVAGRTLKPVAGYFIAPAETVQIKRKNNGTIVRARQLMPDGKYGKEYGKYDVVHFTLDKKVGHPAGTPIVEPVKDDIRTLRRMEEHVDLLVYQHLFPLFQYVVGTDQRPARVLPNGTDEIGIVEQKVEYLPPEGVIVTPERHEIKLIGADGKALKADTYLKHFKERVFAGIGMSSVDFGEGAGASRATANTLSGNTIDDVKDIQDDLEMQFNWQVLRELLLESKFPYNAIHRDHKVQLHFKEINLDAKIAYENHIAQMYEQYIFNEDEARHEIGREPKAIDDEEYREKTFWKMIKEPETIYLAGDETMTAASVSNPNTSVDEADLKRGEQMKESENKRQIVAKKATASAGERSGAASNRPSNQHGKANGPKTRDFISMAGHMIDDGFSTILNDVKGYQATNAPIYWTESVITLWKDRLIEQFSILAADTFSEGCKKYGVDPHTGYLGLNRLDAVRDRTAFYINKLASDLKARVGRLQGDETQKEAMTLIEIHKGRLDGIYKTELTKALNFGHLHGMQVRGLSHAKVVAGDCCEKCKAHDGKKIELATATLDNIASFHTNCTCGYEPTAVVKDSVSFEDSVQTRLYERHLGLPDSQKAMVLRDWIPPKRNVLAVAFGDFIESSNYKVLDTQRFDSWTGKKVALGYIDVEIEPGEYKEVIFGAHYFVKDETGSPLVIQTSFGGFSPSIIIHCLPNRRPAAKKFLDAFDKYTSENNFLRGHLIDPRGQFINTDKINMDDVILENEVKEEIKRRAVDFLGKLPLYVKNNQPTKRGILLEGPPGTGKTMLFKALSNEVGKDITCLWASAGDMDGSREVSWLYELARDMAPAVVFLEDIDTHGGKRNGGKHNPITGELLNQLDGMKSNSGIVTFASTNFIGHLDKALRDRPGRFDIKIHLGEPALPEIKKMLKAFFKNVIIDEAILDSIAEDVVGLTGAYLREIVMQAVSLAIDEDSLDDDDIAIVTLDHLTKAIGTVKHNKEQYSSEKYSDMTADEREAQGRIETCMTDMKTILRVKHPELSDIEINQKAFIACTSQTS